MITPQEAAKLIDWPDYRRRPEVHDFILNASAKDIQVFLHSLNMETPTTSSHEWQSRARMAIDIRIADDQTKSAEKLEHHTVSLVKLTERVLGETKLLRWLTVGLLILTAGLLVFTIYLVTAEHRPHP